VRARPPSRLYQFQKLVRRNRLAFTAAGAVTAAVIAGLAGIIWQWQRAVTNYSMLSIALAEIEAETERVVGQENGPWPTNVVLYYSSAGDRRGRSNAFDRFWQSPSGKREIRVERRAETNRSFTATNLIPPARFIAGNGISVAEQSCTVWDLTSGRTLSPDLHHDSYITYVQFSPDERLLATACSDGTARVWDIQTGRLMTSLLRHAQPVNVIRFAPDGRRIATGSSDFTARVWDVRTGRPLVGPLNADNSPVVSIRFSRDGKHLITLTAQGIVAIWDAQSGQLRTKHLRKLLPRNAGIRG
jgi:WD40 repeat protein